LSAQRRQPQRRPHHAEALSIFSGIFDASARVELNRLPELFCGFPRQSGQGPTLYPVACSPQAWAAGAVFLLLKAVLGLDIDALKQQVTFRSPALPEFLSELCISNLRVGDARLDLRLQRHPDDVDHHLAQTWQRATGDAQMSRRCRFIRSRLMNASSPGAGAPRRGTRT